MVCVAMSGPLKVKTDRCAEPDRYQHREKYREIADIISGQMWAYIAKGKSKKAGRLLTKLRAVVEE